MSTSNNYNLLLLHLAQAEQALHKAHNNAYSDKRKEDYQETLFKLFAAVKEEASTNNALTDIEIFSKYKKYLDFIFKSLEFLDSSTFNQIPYEIIECLDYAMREWLPPNEKYIIVTSLINNVVGFSFDPDLAYNDALYNEIKTRYAQNRIDFPFRLVQINLPRALSRDYLASVVLYHELGHFIDMRFKFTESLTREILNDITIGKTSLNDFNQILIYLPFLDQQHNIKKLIPTNSQLFQVTSSHLAEYFCDLFASQYIEYSSNFYLTYLTENQSGLSAYHPSTVNRVKIVTDFIEKQNNIIVNLINQAVTTIKTGTTLQERNERVSDNDFLNLIPVDIDSGKQLHGLFNTAWNIWLYKQDKLAKSLNDQYSGPLKLYNVLNNLIEKSIGNYITVEKWKKTKQQTTTQ